jgi:hypothetical protein
MLIFTLQQFTLDICHTKLEAINKSYSTNMLGTLQLILILHVVVRKSLLST